MKKLKNLFPALFIAKTGWDRPRKREKNFSHEFRSYSTRARKYRKKLAKKLNNKKTSFRHYYFPKRAEIGREREKNILVLNSVHTRTEQENSKKIAKKIQKTKKPLSGIIFRQNGMI